MDFIAARTRADGILSTKAALIRRAREKGLLAVQRFFLLDSLALESIHSQSGRGSGDVIEVLPGSCPRCSPPDRRGDQAGHRRGPHRR